jgi:hypothetical protein
MAECKSLEKQFHTIKDRQIDSQSLTDHNDKEFKVLKTKAYVITWKIHKLHQFNFPEARTCELNWTINKHKYHE